MERGQSSRLPPLSWEFNAVVEDRDAMLTLSDMEIIRHALDGKN